MICKKQKIYKKNALCLSTLAHKYGDVFNSVEAQSLRGVAEAI